MSPQVSTVKGTGLKNLRICMEDGKMDPGHFSVWHINAPQKVLLLFFLILMMLQIFAINIFFVELKG